jgi:hypothetical protein
VTEHVRSSILRSLGVVGLERRGVIWHAIFKQGRIGERRPYRAPDPLTYLKVAK